MRTNSRPRLVLPAAVAAMVLVSPGFPAGGLGAGVQDLPPQAAAHAQDPCERVPDPAQRAEGLRRCTPIGTSNGVARGDFNGDGFADLAVGSPGEDLGTIQDAGTVTVIYGSANGLSGTSPVASQLWHQNQAGIEEAADANDRFGSALAAGDFNGDGFSDLAIAVPGDNAVQWLFGGASGLTATNDQIIRGTAFVDTRGNPLQFLDGLAWGDFDGDTFGDLAIEARATDDPLTFFRGVVVVLYGSNNTFGLGIDSSRPPIFFPRSTKASTDSFGAFGEVQLSLAGGDFDGDAVDDLAIGVPFNEVLVGGSLIADAGGVFVLRGSTAGGLTATGATALTQETAGLPSEPHDRFGLTLAAGDFDGDGGDDLAVGAPFEDQGVVVDEGLVVVFSSAATLHSIWTQSALAHPRHTGDMFGGALAAGDFNGDGARDLAIGTPGDQLPSNDQAGSVTIVYGSATGLGSGNGPGVQFFTENLIAGSGNSEAGDRFGASLTAWNFGRTAQADLAIGVPDEDILVSLGGTLGQIQVELRADAGQVRVIYGSAGGLTVTGAQVFSQNSAGIPDTVEAGDRFGAAVY